MTIGIGYLGDNYVFLGSDMEITGVAKFPGVKDHFKWFNGDTGVIAATYSGAEDDMRNVWELVVNSLDRMASKTLSSTNVREVLQEALCTVITDTNPFQMLVAISLQGANPVYLRVTSNRIAPAQGWELIGGGDVELSRHLTSLMSFGGPLSKSQAVLWGTYIISKATAFVQGVGQGIRISAISQGRVHYMDGDMFEPKMKQLEEYVVGIYRDFCNLDMPPEEFEARLTAFSKTTAVLRRSIIKLAV